MTRCSSCTLIGSTEVRCGVQCSPRKLQSDTCQGSVARHRFNALADPAKAGASAPDPTRWIFDLPKDELSIVVRQARPRSADAIIGASCLHRRCEGYIQRHDTQADGQRRRYCGRPRSCGRFLRGTRSGAGGQGQVEGRSVDRLIGLDGVLSDIAMMRTPDGHGRVELTKFRRPTADSAEPNNAPAIQYTPAQHCCPCRLDCSIKNVFI